MPRHPDVRTRRAIRVLNMVGELHRRGYQRLRVMPYIRPGGFAWRCLIGPDELFYRDHGACLREGCERWPSLEEQSTSPTTGYTTGSHGLPYFRWRDADKDDARTLADKFLARFTRLAGQGEGWCYDYAGWYQRLLGLAERGWLPYSLTEFAPLSRREIYLADHRPAEWRTENDQEPTLPLPPAGKLQEDVPHS